MLDDAADEVQGGIGQTGIAFASEGVLAILGDGHVHVHAGAVVAVQGLGHEGGGLAVGIGHVVHDVLQGLGLVGLLDQGVELHTDLVLASGRHFVVVDFHDQAHLFQGVAHGGTDFVVVIDRRYREVAALDARTVALVAGLEVGIGVPGSLLGEDLEHGAGDVRLELHFVEDEELGLRADEHGVADAGGLQVFLGSTGDTAGVALVGLHGGGFDDVADQDQGRLFGEGIQNGGAVVGQQDHVGSFDAFPAGDGGAVEHLAVGEEVFVQRVTRRHGDVLLLAFGVGEAQVYPLHVVFFDQLNSLRHGFLQRNFGRERLAVLPVSAVPLRGAPVLPGQRPAFHEKRPMLAQGRLPHKRASCMPVPLNGLEGRPDGCRAVFRSMEAVFEHQFGARNYAYAP